MKKNYFNKKTMFYNEFKYNKVLQLLTLITFSILCNIIIALPVYQSTIQFITYIMH